MILSAWLIDEVQQRLPALVEPEARDAARRIFRDFTYGLLQFTRTVAIVGLVVAGALWLTRREAAQSAIAAVGDAGRALRRRPDAARVAILAAALVALFLFGLSWLGVIITGTILIAGLWTTRTDPADADAART
jgi:ABC-type Fe3+ transport system permease subunit